MLHSFSLYLTKSASTILSLTSLSLTACYFPPSLFLSLLLFFSTSLSHSYLPPSLSPSVLHPSLSYQLPLSISFCAHVNPCTYIPFLLMVLSLVNAHSPSPSHHPSLYLTNSLSLSPSYTSLFHPFPPSFSLSYQLPLSISFIHLILPPLPTITNSLTLPSLPSLPSLPHQLCPAGQARPSPVLAGGSAAQPLPGDEPVAGAADPPLSPSHTQLAFLSPPD